MSSLHPLTTDDLAAVTAIEADVARSPWNLSMFTTELEQGSFGRVLTVAEGGIAGYLLLRPLLDEWHLMTIGVARHQQRRGWGRLLLQTGIDHARRQQGRTLLLEVRPSNLPARRLYDALGFRLLHRRRHYYTTPTAEDALVMALSLVQP
ncbi:MAG: ribosomal protein S18-alanine N-acetyltransferase [Magnetococcales bacterium]|nr:ribosomal protein S18-alanine N-acetyltransferase [Magnetococcales bacterium]